MGLFDISEAKLAELAQLRRLEQFEAGADVAQTYDLIAPRYDSLWNGALAFAENHSLFRGLLDRGGLAGRVLDLGCGTGLLLDWCKEWIPPSCYVGLDVSAGMVAEAKRKHPGYTFMQFDLDEQDDAPWGKLATSVRDRAFDSIVALFAVPSYLRYPDHLVQRLSVGWLRPGGRLSIMPFGAGETYQPDYKLKDAEGHELASEPWNVQRLTGVFEAGQSRLKALPIVPFTSAAFHEEYKGLLSPLMFENVCQLYRQDQRSMQRRQAWHEAMFLLGMAVRS